MSRPGTPANNEIRFRFDERRATEAAALLLRLNRAPMARWRLIKLLYLAERAALERFERPICGGLYYSMDYGPVLGEVLGIIRETADEPLGDLWREHLANDNTRVELTSPIGPGRLRRGEVALLEAVFNKYGRLHRDVLGSLVHGLPEYRRTTERVHRWDIPMEGLLKLLGKTDADIARIREELREERRIERTQDNLARA